MFPFKINCGLLCVGGFLQQIVMGDEAVTHDECRVDGEGSLLVSVMMTKSVLSVNWDLFDI